MDKERVEQLLQQLQEEVDRRAPAEVIQTTATQLGTVIDTTA